MVTIADRRFDVDAFSTLPRRSFLKGLAASAVIYSGDAALSRAGSAPIFLKYPFSLGVASGDPAMTSVVLWTRIAPEPMQPNGGMPNVAVEVNWEIAQDRRFRDGVIKGKEMAFPELAHSVHVEVEGLAPGRDYFYRFQIGTERSQTGRTRTLPAAGAMDEVRFGVAGCQRYEHAYFGAYGEMARENLDFIFLYGDFIYEGRSARLVQDPDNLAREMAVLQDECFSLADYRMRYATYRTDPHLLLAQQSTPFIPIFDDHEVSNDWMSDIHYYGHPSEVFLLRRAAALQAWYEHQPVRKSLLPLAGGMRAFRRFDIGGLMRFNVLDTRQFRNGRFCKGRLTSECAADPADAGQMLGAEQEAWLLDGFRPASQPVWNVLGQQILMSQSHLIPKADKWDRTPAARQRLIDAMVDSKLANPVVLSGDLHFAVAADVKKNFNDPGSATVASEILNLAIASNPPGEATEAFFQKVKAESPHVKYLNRDRGWVRHTVGQKAWKVDMRAMEDPHDADTRMKQLQTLMIEAGKPGIQAG